jgi:outer membrane protein, adhesin transport system
VRMVNCVLGTARATFLAAAAGVGAALSSATAQALAPVDGAEDAQEEISEAQKGEGSQELVGLRAAIAYAWMHNPTVNEALLDLEATGYDIEVARSGYYPYLQIQSAVAEEAENSSTTLAAVVPIWSGGATRAAMSRARAREAQAFAALDQTRIEIARRVAEAYLAVVMADEIAVLWANQIGSLASLTDSIRRRAAGGTVPQSDIQLAITRLKQAQAAAESNRAQGVSARAVLLSLLGTLPTEFLWPDDTYLLTESEIGSNDQSPDDRHPSVQRALAALAEQEALVRESRARLWPEISLQHRRQLEGLTFDPTNDDSTLVVAQFQTGNGLRGYFGARAENQRVQGARARVETARMELKATQDTARAQLVASAKQIQAQGDAAEASAMLVESFSRQFEVGRKSWLELLNAYREAQDSQIQFVGVKRNYWTANVNVALDGLLWERVATPINTSPPAE